MAFINREELKKLFTSRSDLEKISSQLENIKSFCMDNYAFLNQKPETWDNLILDCTCRCVKSPNKPRDIKRLVQKSINNYIKKKIAKQDFRIFNNLLNEIIRPNKTLWEVLDTFFKKLESFDILMTSDLYENLKTKCQIFNNILKQLNITSYSYEWVKSYVSSDYALYRFLKPFNMGYDESISLINKILKFYPDNSYAKFNATLAIDRNDEKLQKLKFLVANDLYFMRIYKLCLESATISLEKFYKILIGYSLKDLKSIKEKAIIYFSNHLDKSFTYKILNDFLKQCDKPVAKETKNQIKEKPNEIFQMEKLYAKFPDYKGVSAEKKQKTIDYLFATRDPEIQEIIKKYITKHFSSRSKEYSKACYEIMVMKKEYANSFDISSITPADPAEIKFAKSKSLRKMFLDENEFFEFASSLESIKIFYVENYNFLGRTVSEWNKIILNCAKKSAISADKLKKTKDLINDSIRIYLNKMLAKRDFQVFENLLNDISEQNKNNIQILAIFFEKLKSFGILITEKVYESFKNDWEVFKNILISLNIESFNYKELETYLSPDYYLYRYLRPINSYIRTSIRIVDKILSFYPENSYERFNKLLKNNQNNSDLKKLKFLIANYYNFEKIYKLCSENTNISLETFYKVLIGYSLNYLKKIIKDFIYNAKDKKFVTKIINDCLALSTKDNLKKDADVEASNEFELEDLCLKFPDYEGVNPEKKLEVVGYLFNSRTVTMQDNIKRYLAGKLNSKNKEYKSTCVTLSVMKKTYEEIQAQRNFKEPSEEYVNALSFELEGISKEKARLIAIELLMLEYIYMCYGFTKNQYKNYQDTLLAEISLANPSLSREAQIREYLKITQDYLQQDLNLRHWQ